MPRAFRWSLASGALALSAWPLAGAGPVRSAAAAPQAIAAPFESDGDIGDVKLPGAILVDRARGEVRLTASGSNIWGAVDAFRFLSRRVTGDVDLAAAVSFVGEGRNPHRKAGLMVRASLAPDASYAHAVVHGDGLVSLQYRETPGGETKELKASLKTVPVALQLSRREDVFTMLAGAPGAPPQQAASVRLALPAAAHAGLTACSHEADWLETAVFARVEVRPLP